MSAKELNKKTQQDSNRMQWRDEGETDTKRGRERRPDGFKEREVHLLTQNEEGDWVEENKRNRE